MMDIYVRVTGTLSDSAAAVLPSLSRLVFVGVLFGYFWTSALTKLGPDLFTPSLGAFAQIFPRAMEAAGYDAGQLGLWHKVVVLAGTWAEFVLPVLIAVGVLTRLAALGMIGFILVQSLTDVIGHKADATTIGAWFDRVPDALIVDQRGLWLLPLVVLVLQGAGPLSLDTLLRRLRKV